MTSRQYDVMVFSRVARQLERISSLQEKKLSSILSKKLRSFQIKTAWFFELNREIQSNHIILHETQKHRVDREIIRQSRLINFW